MQAVHQKLFDYIDAHLRYYLQGWEALSLHHSAVLQRSGMRRPLHERLSAQLQQQGMEVLPPGEDHRLLYAQIQVGASRTLLLYHRYDARYSAQSLLTASATAAALDAYQHAIGPLPVNIKWIFCSEEEPGQVQRLIEDYQPLLQADACLYMGAADFLEASDAPEAGEAIMSGGSLQQEDELVMAALSWGMDLAVLGDGMPVLALGTKGLLCVELEV